MGTAIKKNPKLRHIPKSNFQQQDSFYHSHIHRRCKALWAGWTLGDSFKQNTNSSIRIRALRDLNKACEEAKIAAAHLAGFQEKDVGGFKPRVRNQLSPGYSRYPANISALACVGLSSYLELWERLPKGVFSAFIDSYIKGPEFDPLAKDRVQYKRILEVIAKKVESRILLEEMLRVQALYYVEYYRLFAASQQTKYNLDSLGAIVESVVMFGDIIEYEMGELHPNTEILLKNFLSTSQPFFAEISSTPNSQLVDFGIRWIKALGKCVTIVKDEPKDQQTPDDDRTDPKFGPLDSPPVPRIEPTNPIDKLSNLMDSLMRKKANNPSQPRPLNDLLDSLKFSDILNFTHDQSWKDMGGDIIEQILASHTFARGPVEGMPDDSHTVNLILGGEEVTGELFDRPVEINYDQNKLDKLQEEAKPIIDEINSSMFSNLKRVPNTERYRMTGTLDGNRLPLYRFSDALYKRHITSEEVSRERNPLLLIACDASASLNNNEMKLLKVLTFAFLESTKKTGIKLMAGMYHSGVIGGAEHPLIQWLFHPYKTPAISKAEAAFGLVSLPDKGTGAQSDALSLSFMLTEAGKVARTQDDMIYALILSDCEWNRSFNDSGLVPEGEVCQVISNAYEQYGERLHITLVALDPDPGKSMKNVEELVDHVIKVSNTEISNYQAVAQKISNYVSEKIKERRVVKR